MKTILYLGLIYLPLAGFAQNTRPAFLPFKQEQLIHYTRLDGSTYIQHNGGKWFQVNPPANPTYDQGQLAIGLLQSPQKISFTMSDGTELISYDGLAWAKSSDKKIATIEQKAEPIIVESGLRLISPKLLISGGETEIFFKVQSQTKVLLTVFTPEGTVLYQNEITANPVRKNFFHFSNEFEAGIYGYTLSAEDGKTVSSVFIKQ